MEMNVFLNSGTACHMAGLRVLFKERTPPGGFVENVISESSRGIENDAVEDSEERRAISNGKQYRMMRSPRFIRREADSLAMTYYGLF